MYKYSLRISESDMKKNLGKLIFFASTYPSIPVHKYIINSYNNKVGSWQCLKNQPCDVIKMRDYRSLFRSFYFPLFISSPSFLWRHMADFGDTLSSYIISVKTKFIINICYYINMLLVSPLASVYFVQEGRKP